MGESSTPLLVVCHLYLTNVEAQKKHANIISGKITHLLTVFPQKNEENSTESSEVRFHVGTDRAECITTLELSLAGSLSLESADLS